MRNLSAPESSDWAVSVTRKSPSFNLPGREYRLMSLKRYISSVMHSEDLQTHGFSNEMCASLSLTFCVCEALSSKTASSCPSPKPVPRHTHQVRSGSGSPSERRTTPHWELTHQLLFPPVLLISVLVTYRASVTFWVTFSGNITQTFIKEWILYFRKHWSSLYVLLCRIIRVKFVSWCLFLRRLQLAEFLCAYWVNWFQPNQHEHWRPTSAC